MYVAGIDAHTTYLMVVVVSKQGERLLRPTKVKVAEPEALVKLLAGFRPLEVVVETSSSWPWLYERMSAEGIGFVLAHARKLRAIADANYKRDEVDAELLARMRLAGLIPEVFPTPLVQREWAVLVRHRAQLVGERTRLVNRIHAQLHKTGLRVKRGHLLTAEGQRWLREKAWPTLTPEMQRLARTHIRLIRTINPTVRTLDRRIAMVASAIPAAALLQTIPGIGPYRALVLCAEVLPITRFASPARLVSYAGLAPRSSQSGLRGVRFGPIPAAANRHLRGVFVKAVVSHAQLRPDSWLSQHYTLHKQRVGWPTARIATARRLCRAVYAMLQNGTAWQNTLDSERASISRMSLDDQKFD